MSEMKVKNLFLFAMMVMLFAAVAVSFIHNIVWLFSQNGSGYAGVIQGRWDLLLIYTLAFSSFLVLISISVKNLRWQSSGIYIAFFIALFAEMFGFPLTIYFLSRFLPAPAVGVQPITLFNINFLGTTLSADYNSFVATAISVVGLAFIALGWKKIYESKGRLATSGIYAVVRHPQYFGIILVTLTWLLAWPTLVTLAMWPILTTIYYRLAKSEESLMEKKFGRRYRNYEREVPMLIPFSRF